MTTVHGHDQPSSLSTSLLPREDLRRYQDINAFRPRLSRRGRYASPSQHQPSLLTLTYSEILLRSPTSTLPISDGYALIDVFTTNRATVDEDARQRCLELVTFFNLRLNFNNDYCPR
ncbi:hypothetical protein CPB85DRAFT_1440432 [Mucidula mucida]|nr:hypothetical protein CPB85DRAFT_1440432 [Mucidula mucida]